MSSSAIIAIAIGIVVVLGAIVLVTTARRTDVRGAGSLSGETRDRDEASRRARRDAEALAVTETSDLTDTSPATGSRGVVKAGSAAPVPWTPPDPEAVGVSRRMFLNRATVTLTGTGIGAFAAASFVAFLWPGASGGFGQKVAIAKVDAINDGITAGQGFFYAPAARSWLTHYPSDAVPKAEDAYAPAIFSGMSDYNLVALYQKCPHLGCRVPACVTSQWFECPCHGSKYNQVGEKKSGPAPRGMDRFAFTVDAGGTLTIDTGTVFTGPVIGTNTTGQEAEGPHCISGAGGH